VFHSAVDALDNHDVFSFDIVVKIFSDLANIIDEQQKAMTEMALKSGVNIMPDRDEVKLCPQCGEIMNPYKDHYVCPNCGNTNCIDLDTYHSVPDSLKRVHKLTAD
jgi:NADH pyrophosphatase NudC (nudix superfamily)